MIPFYALRLAPPESSERFGGRGVVKPRRQYRARLCGHERLVLSGAGDSKQPAGDQCPEDGGGHGDGNNCGPGWRQALNSTAPS